MTKWGELIARFQKLREKTSTNKMTSYEVKIWVDAFDGGWQLSLGTYDVADWPRHTDLNFKNEEEALKGFEAKIIEAEKAVDDYLFDDLLLQDEKSLNLL